VKEEAKDIRAVDADGIDSLAMMFLKPSHRARTITPVAYEVS